MLETYISLLSYDIDEMEKRRSILRSESEKEMKLAKQVENDYLFVNALRAKLSRAQTRYDEVIERLQELRLSRSYAGFSTDLLASPEVPKKAAWPILPLTAMIGLSLGIMLGLSLAVAAEFMDSTFSDVADLERAIGAPAIAHVPRFDQRTLRKQMQSDSKVQPSLVTFHAPRSAESEIYRVARTALMISNRNQEVSTMMMTSPQPGDGKSTTISNLAVSFARAGKKVLLIDADMRRPVINGLFAIEGEPGLSDLLTGAHTTDEAIQASEVPNLDLIPNGTSTPAPAELLESPRFSMLLAELSHQYDLVLIDAPPLLAVADPAIIAPMVDAVVLTVRVSKNGRRPVEHAARILDALNVQPSAVVVNGVDQEAKTYGYGTYSRDEYGYVGHYHQRYSAAAERSAGERHSSRPVEAGNKVIPAPLFAAPANQSATTPPNHTV
jgi:capsular exopolysaccharide synthesis family protein